MKTLASAVKQDAGILRSYLKSQGITVSASQALEALSRVRRYRNWATLLADSTKKEKLSPSLKSVRDWPLYVFTIDDDLDSDSCEEMLYVLPAGVRLDDDDRYIYRSGVFNDEDRVMLPWKQVSREHIVVTEVQSVLPRIDKYGMPDYAVENSAGEYFRSLGFACIAEEPEVTFYDLGDDSGSRFWFEAKVHPELAELIERLQTT